MSTNPHPEVYKFLKVKHAKEDEMKTINPAAIGFNDVLQRWYIKVGFENEEDSFEEYSPYSPVGWIYFGNGREVEQLPVHKESSSSCEKV